VAYELVVNGRPVRIDVSGMTPLAFVLRESLRLHGTKVGCFEGRCGACTVLVDGKPVVSCIFPVANAHGLAVRTVEGLSEEDGGLSPLQKAILDGGGVQCGICTPGMLMTLTWHLATEPAATEDETRAALAGNICRCTGYRQILEAAMSLSAKDDR
jgi:carbon-monoxide dehydrogenase small subunit